MKVYMNEINKIPLMTAEEEKIVGRLAFKGDKKAQHKLVMANLRFVVKTAGKYKGCGLDIEDLISEGNAGLMYAATKYNPDCGTKFISYAVWWIRDYISKAICEKGQDVKIPVNKKHLIFDGTFKMTSLDLQIGDDDEGATLGSLVADERCVSENNIVQKLFFRTEIPMAMKKLTDVERTVISMRNGLKDGECKSLAVVGEALGYSKERIRQIENRALVKLRTFFKNRGYDGLAA